MRSNLAEMSTLFTTIIIIVPEGHHHYQLSTKFQFIAFGTKRITPRSLAACVW